MKTQSDPWDMPQAPDEPHWADMSKPYPREEETDAEPYLSYEEIQLLNQSLISTSTQVISRMMHSDNNTEIMKCLATIGALADIGKKLTALAGKREGLYRAPF